MRSASQQWLTTYSRYDKQLAREDKTRVFCSPSGLNSAGQLLLRGHPIHVQDTQTDEQARQPPKRADFRVPSIAILCAARNRCGCQLNTHTPTHSNTKHRILKQKTTKNICWVPACLPRLKISHQGQPVVELSLDLVSETVRVGRQLEVILGVALL